MVNFLGKAQHFLNDPYTYIYIYIFKLFGMTGVLDWYQYEVFSYFYLHFHSRITFWDNLMEVIFCNYVIIMGNFQIILFWVNLSDSFDNGINLAICFTVRLIIKDKCHFFDKLITKERHTNMPHVLNKTSQISNLDFFPLSKTRSVHGRRFGMVLWHINHCWLFNAKSSLFIYIRYKWLVNISQQNRIVPSSLTIQLDISHFFTLLNDQIILFFLNNSI